MRVQTVVSLIFLILTSTLGAKAEPLPPTLELKDAIREALAHNPMLGAMREESSARRAEIEPRAALEDPRLALELTDYPVDSLNPRKSSEAGNRISVRQAIPVVGKRRELRAAATAEFEASEFGVAVRRIDLVAEVKRRYVELSLLSASRAIVGEQSQLVENLLALGRSGFTVGKIPQTDLLTLQVEGAKIIDEQIKLDAMIVVERSEIDHLLGRTERAAWLPESLEKLRRSFEGRTGITLARGDGAEDTPRVKAIEAEHRAAAALERYSRLNRYPDLELMAGYNIRTANDFDDGTDEVSVGVGVTVPLWSGSKQERLVEKAGAERRRREFLLAEERNGVAHDLARIEASLAASSARIQNSEHALLPLNRAAVAAAEKGYGSGSVALTTVLDLARGRLEAELALREAIAQGLKDQIEYDRLRGGDSGQEGE